MYRYVGKALNLKKENGPCNCVNVKIQFDVLEDGKLENIAVYKSTGVCLILERELVAVFQEMPKWKPVKKNNRYVRTNNVVVSIRITLDDH